MVSVKELNHSELISLFSSQLLLCIVSWNIGTTRGPFSHQDAKTKQTNKQQNKTKAQWHCQNGWRGRKQADMRLRARVHTREGAPGNATAGASVMMPARRAACGTYGLRDQGHLCSLDFWPPRSITHAHIHSSGAFGFASTSSSNARKDNGSPTVAGVALHSSPDVFDGASVTRKSHLTVKREGTKRKRREKPENGKRSAMYRWNCPVDTNHSCVMARSPFLVDSSDSSISLIIAPSSATSISSISSDSPDSSIG